MDQLRYERERNILAQDNVRLMFNPEDTTAVATALDFKREVPNSYIEAVSMAPRGAMPHLEDLIRQGIDQATLISDPRHAGSDTWATGRELVRYLGTRDFDCVFCGSHTLNGGTGQVPAQLAEALGLPLMMGINSLVKLIPQEGQAVVDVDGETAMMRFSVALPAVLGFQFNPERMLPYIRYQDQNRDVSSLINVLEIDKLGMDESELGFEGILSQVGSFKENAMETKDPMLLQVDQEGINKVYHWLEQKGFLQP